MTILLTGLSHHTAPLELREQLALDKAQIGVALLQIAGHAAVQEAAIISTCNRVEVYTHVLGGSDVNAIRNHIVQALYIGHCTPTLTAMPPTAAQMMHHFYNAEDDATVDHLMRVACGLDSIVLGETQILGQVVDAHEIALKVKTMGPVLDRLFNSAIHAGKKARNETEIGDRSTSVSHTAAQLIDNTTNTDELMNIVIIGAGEVAELAAIALRDRQVSDLHIINRTLEHAQELADKVGGNAHLWSDLWTLIAQADVVVCTTGAPHTILQEPDIARLMSRRDDHPLFMVDLAMPRDIDAKVAHIPGVTLYDIDDLQQVVDDNIAHRQASIPQVESIIIKEHNQFVNWLRSRQIVPVITDLRRKVQNVADNELRTALNRLSHLDDQERAVIEQLAHRIVNKVLHQPTMSLRQHAVSGDGDEFSQVVRDLFALTATTTVSNEEHAPHG